MRKLGLLMLASLMVGAVGCQKGATGSAASGVSSSATAATPTTDDQKTLYAIGLVLGQKMGALALTPDELQYVSAGFTAAALKQKPAVEIQQWGPKIQAFAQARGQAAAKANEEKGKAFLEQAAKEPGAVKTPAGFVFKSEKEGTGAAPTASDTVEVNYRGTLPDGTEFDSSYKRNKPATFPLRGVIPCWTQGIPMMKVGGKAKLTCPANLAYGQRMTPGIPPGSTLTFEVELLSVKPAPAPSPNVAPHMMPGSKMTTPPKPMSGPGKMIPAPKNAPPAPKK